MSDPYRALTAADAHRFLTDSGHSSAAAEHFIHWHTGLGYPLTIERLRDNAAAQSTITAEISRAAVERWVDATWRPELVKRFGRDWVITDRLDALTRLGHAIAHAKGTTTGRTEVLVAAGHNPQPPQHLRNAAL